MLKSILCLVIIGLVAGEESFFEVDRDFKAAHRELLQVQDETEDDLVNDVSPETELNKNGPTMFSCKSKGKKGQAFVLSVKKGIKLSIYRHGTLWDSFLLDKEAQGGVQGSMVDESTFQVDIIWKKDDFQGDDQTVANKIQGLQIEIKFNLSTKEYKMTELNIADLDIPSTETYNLNLDVHVKTKCGYKVDAPKGLSFSCYTPCLFPPVNSTAPEHKGYSAGLLFPGLQLQVGDNSKIMSGDFGPAWDCGVVFPIGLWVGIIITLFFAIICCWGFSMLANINTMDRFDDPKGKSINVPQTE